MNDERRPWQAMKNLMFVCVCSDEYLCYYTYKFLSSPPIGAGVLCLFLLLGEGLVWAWTTNVLHTNLYGQIYCEKGQLLQNSCDLVMFLLTLLLVQAGKDYQWMK